MKNTIYITILVLMLSCNKKAEDMTINTSTKEQFNSSEDSLSELNSNLDSISKKNKKGMIEVSSDTNSVEIKDALKIEKELNGVWNVVEMSPNKPDNVVGIIYKFFSKNKTLEVYLPNELRGQYNYQIVSIDCEGNKKNIDSFYIKLSGDDNYCSKIVGLKYKNNKTYLILKENISETQDKEFLKINDDPYFFPKGYDN